MTAPGRRIFTVAAFALVCGLGFQILERESAYHFEPKRPLREYLPPAGAGWTSEDHSLGETEFISEQAQSILRTDDFVFRTYRKGVVEFSVYCSFWRPFTQTVVDTAAHTPDKCWVQAGWLVDNVGDTVRLMTASGLTWPGQARLFQRGHVKQHVVFWHIKGGSLTGYGMGDQSAWKKRAPVLFSNLRAAKFGLVEYEQYLVRISSSQPIVDLMADEQFARVLDAVSKFGLIAR